MSGKAEGLRFFDKYGRLSRSGASETISKRIPIAA
jgi:hypothetical protein